VLRVLATLDGEVVSDANCDIGYLHRCFEKIAERRTINQVIPYTDRTDYLAAITNELAYVMAIEQLMGIEVPLRAQYIRFIFSELQRISSHLVWFGAFALDLGATTPFLYAWREREVLLDVFEEVTGARMLYNYVRVGGVRNDLTPTFAKRTESFLSDLEKRFVEYQDLLTGNAIFEARTKGIGVLSAADAIAYGASGPVLRGSGVQYDIRKNQPYLVYDKYDFKVPVGSNGDCYDRYIVRMQEMAESLKLVRHGLADLPAGDFIGDVPRRIKLTGDTYARVESPRGEVGCFVAGNGSDVPYRVKWRAPGFVHLQLVNPMSKGALLADLVADIGSLDIVMGEVDR
jgi:NADH-quinone oxidoreductase subunit D